MSIMKTVIKRTIFTKRRRLESVFACVALIALVSSSVEGLITPANQSKQCLSPECISTALAVMGRMKSEIEPCDDFYQFACGSFIENTPIPEDAYTVDEFSKILDKVQQQLNDIVREERPKDDPKHLKLPHTFYAACMDEDFIEALGPKPIQRIVNKLGGWPVIDCDCWDYDNNWTWQETVRQLRHLGFYTNNIIEFSIVVDKKNSTKHIIQLGQPSTGLSPEYLIKGFNDSVVLAYYDYMVDIAVLFGADKEIAKRELRKSLQFEINLAKIFNFDEQDMYHLRSIKQLQESYPYVQWLDYVNIFLPEGVKVTEDEIIILTVPSFFENLGKLLESTKKRDIANSVMWQIHDFSVDYLSEKFRKRKFQYKSVLLGLKQEKARWERCVDEVSVSFGSSLGSLYVRKYFKDDSKAVALEIVNNILEAFRIIIDKTEWMDNSTKQEAQKKLKLMTTHIGYSEELLNNKTLEEYYRKMEEIDPYKFLKSALKINIFNNELSCNKLRMPVKKNDWSSLASPAVVNAYYSDSDNSIEFPAAILQGHWFNSQQPRYMNYGGIGYIIGHEITHGFDQGGSQYNGYGNLMDWWDPATKKAFEEKAKCIVEQYSNYTDQQTELKLNGVYTQKEDVADNGAIKQTYMAYKQWLAKNGEEPQLLGLNYTSQQMFWIASTQTWCSKFRTEALKYLITTEKHTPPHFRALGPLRNMPAFSTDFKCALGTAMNPVKKCEVW